jgi:Ras-related protein Rab-21
VLALVGNKCDSPSEFEFTKAQEFAKEIGASVFKTSAKTGDGVHELFETVAMDLLKKHDEKEMLRKRSTPTNTAKPEDVLFLTDSKNRSSSSSKKSKCC